MEKSINLEHELDTPISEMQKIVQFQRKAEEIRTNNRAGYKLIFNGIEITIDATEEALITVKKLAKKYLDSSEYGEYSSFNLVASESELFELLQSQESEEVVWQPKGFSSKNDLITIDEWIEKLKTINLVLNTRETV